MFVLFDVFRIPTFARKYQGVLDVFQRIRMNRYLVFSSVFLLINIWSCNERDFENPIDDVSGELVADPAFNWATSTKVEIEIMALELPVDITRKLSLRTDDGSVFYAGSQKMSENFTLSVELPNHSKSVTMSYGDIEKTLEVTGSTLRFDYLK